MDSATILRSARKEALFTVAFWILTCLYTVGYAALFGYRQDPAPQLLWGIPTWVVYGVLTPWFVCTVVTCWYAFFGYKDEELGEDVETEASHAEDEEGRDG